MGWEVSHAALRVVGVLGLLASNSAAQQNAATQQGETSTLCDEVLTHGEPVLESASVVAAYDAARRSAARACALGRRALSRGEVGALEALEEAAALDPQSAEHEYYLGVYYATVRGAFLPAVEAAERHFYRALELIEARRAGGTNAPDLAAERKTRWQLALLYQHDGIPLLPWKAYPQTSSGLYAPHVAARGFLRVGNEYEYPMGGTVMRSYASEANYANSSTRRGGVFNPLTRQERQNIIRSGLNLDTGAGVRVRHSWLGVLEAGFQHQYQNGERPTSYYFLPDEHNDTTITSLGASFDRTFAVLDWLDVRLHCGGGYVERTGFAEFLPTYTEKFPTFWGAPSLSRAFSGWTVRMSVDYQRADVPDAPNSVSGEAKRDIVSRAAYVDVFDTPNTDVRAARFGSFLPYGAVAEGWHFYAGYRQIDLADGVRTRHNYDVVGGARMQLLRRMALHTAVGWYGAGTEVFDINRSTPDSTVTYFDETQSVSHLRVSAVVSFRPWDNLPVLGRAHSTFIALPLSWEAATGVTPNFNQLDTVNHSHDYENVRFGAALWNKGIWLPAWGTSTLFGAGYSFQYFYELEKAQNFVWLTSSIGWG